MTTKHIETTTNKRTHAYANIDTQSAILKTTTFYFPRFYTIAFGFISLLTRARTRTRRGGRSNSHERKSILNKHLKQTNKNKRPTAREESVVRVCLRPKV